MKDYSDYGAYLPSEDIIQQKCREIQSGWDEAEEWRRRVVKNPRAMERIIEFGDLDGREMPPGYRETGWSIVDYAECPNLREMLTVDCDAD